MNCDAIATDTIARGKKDPFDSACDTLLEKGS
jgi:hypothetical protein